MKPAEDFSDLNIYEPPYNNCPLCASKAIQKYYYIDKYSLPFKVDKCADCGFIFMNPRFNDITICGLYKENYYTGNADYAYYDEREAERYSEYVWEKRLKKIRKYVDAGNFLDIGCAFGGFLKTVSQYYTPYGIELSEYSGDYAKRIFGNTIHTGTLNDHPFNKDFFSVITMIELLEHLSDPVYAVNECYGLLKEKGLFVIQTANMDGLQAKLLRDRYAMFMPGHLSYFTKNNLIHLLEKTGFKIIKAFHPVEFGLLPKLLKSRYQFKSYIDYIKWLRIAYYHYISKIRFGNFAATSSMVLYAFK
jgi:2-polyprenyl-3-methyl-5-hydroxy-6-metoxy-1,4-benzoquinol methylase